MPSKRYEGFKDLCFVRRSSVFPRESAMTDSDPPRQRCFVGAKQDNADSTVAANHCDALQPTVGATDIFGFPENTRAQESLGSDFGGIRGPVSCTSRY